jgi:GTP cyclohydrolase I
VTEKAYKNAKFVEDVVRDISLALQSLKAMNKFKIKVVNEESIHPHNAVAYIARKLQGTKWVRDDRGLKG